MNEYRGDLNGSGLQIAIACAQFNEYITERLLSGARNGLLAHGVDEESISVAWVPGAFELPLVAQTMAMTDSWDAVICLGAVIRGSTPHFDYVAAQCAAGIQQAQLRTGIPVIFGVLTTDNVDQAVERAGAKMGNKGFDAAMTAIEMAQLMRKLPKSAAPDMQ